MRQTRGHGWRMTAARREAQHRNWKIYLLRGGLALSKLYNFRIVVRAIDVPNNKALAERICTLLNDESTAIEQAAKLAEGEEYKEVYVTWSWWDGGNMHTHDPQVRHCAMIAAHIRKLKLG